MITHAISMSVISVYAWNFHAHPLCAISTSVSLGTAASLGLAITTVPWYLVGINSGPGD